MRSYFKCVSANRLREGLWRICGKLFHLCHLVEGVYEPYAPDELDPDELDDDEELEPDELEEEGEVDDAELEDDPDSDDPDPAELPDLDPPDSELRESVR